MQCPKCDFENLAAARFCGHCGTRMVRDCPICGLANPIHYQYCHRCGVELVSASTPLTAPPSPAQQTQIISATATNGQPLPSPTNPTPAIAAAPVSASSSRLQGERRIATIVMADVQGSTDMLEDLGTEAWVEMMNRVFQILEIEIYRFGGTIDQFRGDGLVAFFGATAAHEDDPERAILAALAMQKALIPYATELNQSAHVNLRLRVGVNTGEIIVTSVGDRRKYSENTAMGGGITLAARMESAAEAHTVLVSGNTYALVQGQFEWLDLGEIHAKGIRQAVPVYRPLRPSKGRNDAYDLSNPLIGRDAEVEALRTCVKTLHAGHGGIVTLTGERGMGKSLLLREVRHYFARKQALLSELIEPHELHEALSVASPDTVISRMLRGRCRSYDQSQPYAMWLDLLRNWLNIQPDEDKITLRDRLRQQSETLWGPRWAEYYPYLVDFLGLPLEASYAAHIQHLDAEGRRQQYFLALRSWVTALAAEGPLGISFSDMHWSDKTSLDLLRYCLPLCDQFPILWLLIFRPERHTPVWKFRYILETDYPHRLTNITLLPLDKANSQRFIEHIIGAAVLPAETEDLVIEKAQGNPYYIQELIRALIENGVLIKKDTDKPDGKRQWVATQTVTELDLPDSLHTLLLSRIDRLKPAEYHVLQMAATIGAVFWCNILKTLSGDEEWEQKYLTGLLRAQLIREQGRDADLGTEYVFKSPLIREAAYEGLLSTQRADYHRRIAAYFENRFEMDARTPYFGTLAYHYQHAEQADKELFYILKQATHAKASYASAEASAHYTRALILLDELAQAESAPGICNTLRTQRFDALYERHEVYHRLGDFNAMWDDVRALLPLARQLKDAPGRLIDAILAQPSLSNTHDPAQVTAMAPLIAEAATLAQQLGDKNREIKVLIAQANQCLTLDEADWQMHAENALALAQDIGDQRYEARLLIGLGKLYAKIDQQEWSLAYAEAAAALALSSGLDDVRIQTGLLGLLGMELERNGDYYQQLTEYAQEQLYLSHEIGHRPLESEALMSCGIIQGVYLGDYETGLSLLAESQSIMENTPYETPPRLISAQIYIALDMLPEAQTLIQQITATQLGENKHTHTMLDLTTAMLYYAMGDSAHLHTALDLLTQIRQTVAQKSIFSQQYEMVAACKATSIHLALAKLTTDKTEQELQHSQALKDSQIANTLYEQFGYAQSLECVSEEILFWHAQALAANGYTDEAINYLRQAYDEMIYKYARIPADSPFRRTYLDNIPLHQDIRIAYAARVGSILTADSKAASPVWVEK